MNDLDNDEMSDIVALESGPDGQSTLVLLSGGSGLELGRVPLPESWSGFSASGCLWSPLLGRSGIGEHVICGYGNELISVDCRKMRVSGHTMLQRADSADRPNISTISPCAQNGPYGDSHIAIGFKCPTSYGDCTDLTFGIYNLESGILAAGLDVQLLPSRLGYRSILIPDANSDGVEDWLVSGVRAFEGEVSILSGATLKEIESVLSSSWSPPEIGGGLANLGDVDGDGTDDWAIQRFDSNCRGAKGQGVLIITGKTRKVLYSLLLDDSGEPALFAK